jgi:hypothetical protein
MLFALRFDLRNPEVAGTTMADRYAAALDIAEWADRLGCVNITVSEHHGSPDGYLPSPIPMLAARRVRRTCASSSPRSSRRSTTRYASPRTSSCSTT